MNLDSRRQCAARDLLRGLFDGYYHDLHARKVVFKHDVDNVVFDTREFDARPGTHGLHDVRPQARPEARESILPPDLWKKYKGASIWRDPAFNSRGVSILPLEAADA